MLIKDCRSGVSPGVRWAAAVLLVGQRAAAVEELVSLHDVQAYRQTRCQNSRCKFGARFTAALERHRPAGGTAASAGVPVGFQAFRRPVTVCLRIAGCVLEEFSERIRGKGAFCVGVFTHACPVGLSAICADPPLKSAPACASAPLRLHFTADALGAVALFGGQRLRCVGKAATWLILPVVICLSQRLSHACLSINCFIL